MKHILFVDDDENILHGIRRILHPMRKQWRLSFASSGKEALKQLETGTYDAIISDTRMPGMNGIELLNKVKTSHPNMIRIGLSGHAEEELSLLSAMSTHQQLTKPCEKEQLITTLQSALQQSERITNDALKTIITSTESLPSLPSLYQEITSELQLENGNFKRIAALIAQDMSVSAKMLQLVNSSFFGIPRHVSSIEQAVILLGYDLVKALILNIKILDQFSTQQLAEFDIHGLWAKSMEVTQITKQLTKQINLDNTLIDHAQIASILLDIGTTLMISKTPDQYREVLKIHADSEQPLNVIEQQVYGCTQSELGAALLGIWGLPAPVTSAVHHHLSPSESEDNQLSALTIVHLANAFHLQSTNPYIEAPLDTPYLESLNISEKDIAQWQPTVDQIEKKKA